MVANLFYKDIKYQSEAQIAAQIKANLFFSFSFNFLFL